MKIKSPNHNLCSEAAVGGYIFVFTWRRLNVKILKISGNMQYHLFYNVTIFNRFYNFSTDQQILLVGFVKSTFQNVDFAKSTI